MTLSGATDPEGEAVTTTITGVTQDKAVDGPGDGDTALDAQVGPTGTASTSEPSGAGRGVPDGGGTCSGVVTVGVPHDQGPKGGPVDSGLTVDSFGS